VKSGAVGFYGVDNHQTRMLSGDLTLNSSGLPCFDPTTCIRQRVFTVGPQQLRMAVWNLVFHYPVWGVLEDMPGYMRRLSKAYSLPLESKHVHAGKFKIQDASDPKTLKELEDMLAPDTALSRFVTCMLASGSPRFT
jgi:hypothetical protein